MRLRIYGSAVSNAFGMDPPELFAYMHGGQYYCEPHSLERVMNTTAATLLRSRMSVQRSELCSNSKGPGRAAAQRSLGESRGRAELQKRLRGEMRAIGRACTDRSSVSVVARHVRRFDVYHNSVATRENDKRRSAVRWRGARPRDDGARKRAC